MSGISIGSSYFMMEEADASGESKMEETISVTSSIRSSSTARSRRISKPLNFQDHFCGREEELLQLEGIFRCTAHGRANAQKYPPFVLVGGASGAGKSTLVSKLKDHLSGIEEEFFWISGKFEEGNQQTLDSNEKNPGSKGSLTKDSLHPFAALVDAFRVFCQELEEEEPETLEELKTDVRKEVGEQGALLSAMIPSLGKIVGTQVGVEREAQQNELSQFHFVFKGFLQALATSMRSVVIVLDDVHRADPSSLKLLYSLLTGQVKHVMMIGTYRSSEVDEDHHFTKWLNRVQEAQDLPTEQNPKSTTQKTSTQFASSVTRIGLGGMDLETINCFLSKVLQLEPDNTRALAHIVYTKTKGNTLFAIQYLLYLKKKELLWYNEFQKCWSWDEPVIRSEAAVTTTLLDFMRDKLLQSTAAPKILPVAACLGAKFDSNTLGLVLSALTKVEALKEIVTPPDSKMAKLLKSCEKEGYIDHTGGGAYIFVHDKMQEAALSLHPAISMQQIRYEAGTALLRQFNEAELDEHLFVVVNLLNAGHLRNDAVTPFEVAKLNLTAAIKAKRMGAFSIAATYTGNGLVAFPQHLRGEEQRAFFLELCSIGAEVEIVLGHYDKVEKYCDLIFDSPEKYTLLEKLRAKAVLLNGISHAGGRMEVALKQCLSILGDLHCAVPKYTIGQAALAVSSLLKAKNPKNIPTMEDIDKMELMTDLEKVASMRLLDRACTYAYVAAKPLILVSCMTKMVKSTIQYGLCGNSPCAFALIGISMMHRMGDYKAGVRYGELAVSMMKRLQALSSSGENQDPTLTRSESRATALAHGRILVWVRPLKDYKDELMAGYHCGMRSGDTDSAVINAFNHIGIKFAAGFPLQSLEEVCYTSVSAADALQIKEVEGYFRVYWQLILHLMSYSSMEGRTDAFGNALPRERYLNKEKEWGSKLLPFCYDNIRTILFVFFGEYIDGANLAIERGDSLLRECLGSSWCLLDPLFRGVSLYAAAYKTKKRRYKQHAQRVRKTLQSWVRKGNPTAVHQLKLLDAEHAALLGKRDTAKELYVCTCKLAADGGFVYAEALANLRYAEFLLSLSHEDDFENIQDDMEEGRSRLHNACRMYKAWGARGVVDSLRDRYPEVGIPEASKRSWDQAAEPFDIQ